MATPTIEYEDGLVIMRHKTGTIIMTRNDFDDFAMTLSLSVVLAMLKDDEKSNKSGEENGKEKDE